MNSERIKKLSDGLLAIIRRRPGHHYAIRYLCKKLGDQPDKICLAGELLRQTGYSIKIKQQKTIAFLSAPDILLAQEITYKLSTKKIGKTVHSYKSVQSTNSIAGQLAHARTPEGTIVIAEAQTKGRGRLGRSWFSVQGKGIYLSIILYPDLHPLQAPGLSLMTAVSLADTIADLDELTVNVKWPNDCLVNGKKVAGILTELSSELGKVHHAVIGIGINVNHRRSDFPQDIKKTATSLRVGLKKKVNRIGFLQSFLKHFEKDYSRFQKNGLKSFRKRLVAYSNLMGKQIRLDMKGTIIEGVVVDFDENGGLVVETAKGRRVFHAGEVTIVKDRRR